MSQNRDQNSASAGYERRDVNLNKLAVWAVVSIIVVIALVLFVTDYFTASREALIDEMVLQPQSVQIRELRAREAEVLGSYKLLDSAAGVYRIPLDRAMQLVEDEAFESE